MIRIGLVYNLREDFPGSAGDPTDAAADWDVPATIEHLRAGLDLAGFEVTDLGDPLRLLDPVNRAEVDLVLSICEMAGYRFREALVPSMCELLGLPYMLSSPDVLIATLDKNLANLVLDQAGIPIADWAVVAPGQEPAALCDGLDSPLVVKPVAEGSGMGVELVDSSTELKSAVARIHVAYGQPAIVQRFLGCREFTVGVLEGQGGPRPLGVIEVAPLEDGDRFLYGYQAKEGHGPPVSFTPVEEQPLTTEMQALAVDAFEVLDCRDGARVDIRFDEQGSASVLEVNPLPHLDPDIGDFCRSASAAGLEYQELLRALVESACRRWGL